MSENDPAPSKQTSSIPLKKETVRVTLKAADAPPASPSSGTAPVVRPPSPTAPPAPTVRSAPTATAPTVGGAPRPAPAATIPLKTAPGAGIPKPAPTIALKSGPVAPASPTTPGTRPGLPGAATGGSTISLPKATVQLTPPTSPMGATLPPQSISTLSADDEDEAQESGLANILSIVGFAAALVVLYFQFSTASTWVKAEDNEKAGQWGQLFE